MFGTSGVLVRAVVSARHDLEGCDRFGFGLGSGCWGRWATRASGWRVSLAGLAVAALVVVAPLARPQVASADPFTWSGAIALDRTGGSHSLNSVACASSSQCTAVDNAGKEVTFNPASPGSPNPSTLKPGWVFDSVACPSASQCTAVAYGAGGLEETFDPTSGHEVSAPFIDFSGASLVSVACPSVSQCTAVDSGGNEVTFDQTGADNAAGVTAVDPGHVLNSVACPSASQCTAVDQSGDEVTFDPTSGTVNAAGVKAVDAGRALNSVACPSASQCMAVDSGGNEVTFDPTSGTVNATGVKAVDPGQNLSSVACPSGSQCTAVGGGNEVTFDPTAPGTPSPVAIVGANSLNGVACSSMSECVTVDSVGNGFAGLAAHALAVSHAGSGAGTVTSSPAGISCPGACSHSYTQGTTVTLTPAAAPGSTFAGWSGGGCSGTGTCTVTMSADQSVTATFNIAGGGGGPQTVKLVGSPQATAHGATLKLSCSAKAGQRCQTNEKLSSTETVKGGTPIAVTSTAKKRKKRVVVGSKSMSIAAGHTQTIVITLNAVGNRLLKRFGKLPVTLTVRLTLTGHTTTVAARKLTIKPKKKSHANAYDLAALF